MNRSAITRKTPLKKGDFPGRRNWRRWNLTSRVSSLLYASGITRSGGTASHDGADPHGFWVYSLPSWRHVLPKRGALLRPYVLWKPDWWWQCHKRQGLKLVGRHRPEEPWGFNVCAACCPCGECGAHYECADDCPMVAS